MKFLRISDVAVVELCEDININDEISTLLEDRKAASLLPDHFDCLCNCDAFLDFSSTFFFANSSFSFLFSSISRFFLSFSSFSFFFFSSFSLKIANPSALVRINS